ncbi:maternal pumilio protein [Vairimorpha apis BRL 01]|uniref:Maternal pumilio protein n=1 Tax=Vairimorpha apis BRL 01 TaxID=1037528 RepID=T0ML40_9MICR|nr:maternal pumilio protein [Vairimorpha apis BRL 01]
MSENEFLKNSNAYKKFSRPCSAPPVDKLFVSDEVELFDIQYSSYYRRNSKDDVRIPPPDYKDSLKNFNNKAVNLIEKIDNENPESKCSEYKGTSRTTTPIGDTSILDPSLFSNFLNLTVSQKNTIKKNKNEFEISTKENLFLKDIFLFFSDQDKPDLNLMSMKDFCVHMSKDQEGSRLIQNRIDISNDEEIVWFFNQIEDSIFDLSSNLFGNYVIQKILPRLNETQKFVVFTEFKNKINDLALHPYGCRVITKINRLF